MSCTICFEKYNTRNNKPIILMMCGHTFCSNCVEIMKTTNLQNKCPTCKETIVRERPNYSLLDILENNGNDGNNNLASVNHQQSRQNIQSDFDKRISINFNDQNLNFRTPYHPFSHTFKKIQNNNE